MKQLTALAWKEWRETQIYLWIGLGCFLGLPLIGGIEEYFTTHNHRFDLDLVAPVVGALGGVLAVFVAVGATCRDLDGRVEDFWRSRPVTVKRWLENKYLIGLGVTLLACVIPLLVADGWASPSLEYYPCLWWAMYSVAFAAGCLLRRTAHAAFIGIVAMLLLLCLPAFIPPLHGLAANQYRDRTAINWPEFLLVLATALTAVVALRVAMAAVNRGWKVESNIRLIYTCIAVAIVIGCVTAGLQVGTALPLRQKINLPDSQSVQLMDIQQGMLIVSVSEPDYLRDNVYQHAEYDIPIKPGNLQLPAPINIRGEWYGTTPIWQSDGSRVRYEADTTGNEATGAMNLQVLTLPATGAVRTVSIRNIKLWDLQNKSRSQTLLLTSGKTLYVVRTGAEHPVREFNELPGRIFTFDISDPNNPKSMSESDGDYHSGTEFEAGDDQCLLRLMPIPNLSATARLNLQWGNLCKDGVIIFGSSEYRLSRLTDSAAAFERVGTAAGSILDWICGSNTEYQHVLENGFVYQPMDARRGLPIARRPRCLRRHFALHRWPGPTGKVKRGTSVIVLKTRSLHRGQADLLQMLKLP